jgi:hypothetical protein
MQAATQACFALCAAPQTCPQVLANTTNITFYLNTSTSNWTYAEEMCKQNGGHLAAFQSLEEQVGRAMRAPCGQDARQAHICGSYMACGCYLLALPGITLKPSIATNGILHQVQISLLQASGYSLMEAAHDA